MYLAFTSHQSSSLPLSEGPRGVVDRSIDRLVLLMSAEHEIQTSTLQNSFRQAIQSSFSREIVYTKLIQRMSFALANERILVLFKCVQLLKAHLFQSPPSLDLLQHLHEVLVEADESIRHAISFPLIISTSHTVHFLLAHISQLISLPGDRASRHLSLTHPLSELSRLSFSDPLSDSSRSESFQKGSPNASPPPPTLSVLDSHSKGTSSFRSSRSSRTPSIAAPESTLHSDDLKANAARTSLDQGVDRIGLTNDLSIMNDSLISPQFAKSSGLPKPSQMTTQFGLFVIRDHLLLVAGVNNDRQIQAVVQHKKKEEQSQYPPHLQAASQVLFQYRPYDQQAPLQLTSDDFELIQSGILDSDPASRKMATEILIKLLIDLYLAGKMAEAATHIKTVCSLLLTHESPLRMKIHAFDLIFNLSTHINLISDFLISDPKSPSEMIQMLFPHKNAPSGEIKPIDSLGPDNNAALPLPLPLPLPISLPLPLPPASSAPTTLPIISPTAPLPTPIAPTALLSPFAHVPSTPAAAASNDSASTHDMPAHDDHPSSVGMIPHSESSPSINHAPSPLILASVPTPIAPNPSAINPISAPSPPPRSPRRPTPNPPKPTTTDRHHLTQTILHDLLELMKHLFDMLHQSEEEDENVWSAALSSLLFLTARDGDIPLPAIMDLCPMIYVNCLRYLNDHVLQRKLVEYLITSLTVMIPVTEADQSLRQVPAINLPLLESIGGINTLIDLYIRVHSVSSKCNLFAAIYSYVVQKVFKSRKRQIQDWRAHAEGLFRFLCMLDAPQCFWRFFLCLPESMLSRLVSRIRRYQSAAEKVAPGLIYPFSKRILSDILKYFEQIAYNYSKPDLQYSVMLQAMLNNAEVENEDDDIYNKDIADKFELLTELLNSPLPKNRKSGEAWLFGLARAALDGKAASHQLRTGIASAFEKVTTSPNPKVRAIHMRITEKMLLYRLFNMRQHADRRQLAQVLELFNANLAAAVTQDERDLENLTMMFHIIFNFVLRYRVRLMPQEGSLLFVDTREDKRNMDDSPYSLFLSGLATVSVSLIQELNISLFSQLFTHLPTRKSRHHRVALLLIMINKCQNKKADLDTLDISFFRNLLKSRDPEIALHAAKFLLDQLNTSKPEEYRTIISRLLSLAQKTGDETLLTNPFLQIISLVNRGRQAPDAEDPATSLPEGHDLQINDAIFTDPVLESSVTPAPASSTLPPAVVTEPTPPEPSSTPSNAPTQLLPPPSLTTPSSPAPPLTSASVAVSPRRPGFFL